MTDLYAQAAPPRRRARVPARRRGTPGRSAAFSGVRLPVLRSYRRQLRSEEGRVSYWRRVVHARIDTVDGPDASDARHDGDPTGLRAVLSTSRVTSGRTALLSLHPAEGMPPLPNLAEMWDRMVPDGDADGRDRLLADLRDAERQLSDYRRALHTRLDAATTELIARYAEDPSLCLSLLPGTRGPGARTS